MKPRFPSRLVSGVISALLLKPGNRPPRVIDCSSRFTTNVSNTEQSECASSDTPSLSVFKFKYHCLPSCPSSLMACSCTLPLFHKIQNSSVPSLCISKASPAFPMRTSTPFPSRFLTRTCFKSKSTILSVSTAGTSFTWDDVLRISQPESLPDEFSDISGFFQKVKICNRGSVKPSGVPLFICFVPQKCKA